MGVLVKSEERRVKNQASLCWGGLTKTENKHPLGIL